MHFLTFISLYLKNTSKSAMETVFRWQMSRLAVRCENVHKYKISLCKNIVYSITYFLFSHVFILCISDSASFFHAISHDQEKANCIRNRAIPLQLFKYTKTWTVFVIFQPRVTTNLHSNFPKLPTPYLNPHNFFTFNLSLPTHAGLFSKISKNKRKQHQFCAFYWQEKTVDDSWCKDDDNYF